MVMTEAARRAPARTDVAEPVRPPLRVVEPPGRRRRQFSMRRSVVAAVVMIMTSLLAVAGAQAYLTQGQVRLTELQGQLTTQVGLHRDLELRVARLENPARVVTAAQEKGLTVPKQITDLTQVTTTVPPAAARSTTAARHGSAKQATGHRSP